MRLTVLCFALLRDELGESLILDLPDGATVADLRRALGGVSPVVAALGQRALIAINEAYAFDGDVLHEADTVAVLPPVSGG